MDTPALRPFLSTMRFTFAAALLSAASLSSAHIVGVTGPATYAAKANSNYPLTFLTMNGPITKYGVWVS